MSCLVFGFDKELSEWAAGQIPHMAGHAFGPCRSIGVFSGNDPADASAKIQAVAVFHDYLPPVNTMQISMAARSFMWARKDIIRALLHYAFEQQEVYLLWTATPHRHEKALKVNEHIGFKRDGVLRHRYGPKNHAVMMSMTKHEYARAWKNELRQVSTASA